MRDRRSLLIANQQGGGGGYVTDGLTLFLDGLNQGGVTGKWIDTIGGEEFTLTNAVQNNGYVTFSGGWARSSNTQTFGTIEIVLKFTSTINTYNSIITGAGRGLNLFKNRSLTIDGVQYGRFSFGGYTSSPSVPIVINTAESYVGTDIQYNGLVANNVYTKCYKNGLLQSTVEANDSWGSNQSGFNVGYYTSYGLTADVYAVRLYNRQLTADEIAQNYAVDKERYGI